MAQTFAATTLRLTSAAVALMAALAGVEAAEIPDAQQLLLRADDLRLPPHSVEVKIGVVSVKDGESEEAVEFRVLQNKGLTESLAVALSHDQRGQKYLYARSGLWFYAPGTRRAIRITPIQRLRGETVIGDLVRLRLAQDYTATLVGEESVHGEESWVLDLDAKERGMSFPRIRMRLAKSSSKPVTAEYFLTSGKLYRTANFGNLRDFDGYTVIESTVFVDGVNANSRTRLDIRDVERKTFPSWRFTVDSLTQ